MDGSGRSEEKDSIKVGDIEKEKEIERRLRELGLWENKRILESRVASMLDAHIEEQDVLSRTLRKYRRRRAGGEAGDGKTAVDEIRNIISPRVIRDCYGQRLAYEVNILMGRFTKNIEHEVIDDVVIIRGTTAVDESDPKRLTKELRLELPVSLNMASLQMSYVAGAVRIRVPYLIETPPQSQPPSLQERAASGSTDDRPAGRLTSISPIYSLSMALSSANRTNKVGSSGADSLCSDSPNSATSLSSPQMPAATSADSLPESITDSPTVTLPSPFPVFEDDTSGPMASGTFNGKGNGRRRCINNSTLEGRVGSTAAAIAEEVHRNGFSFVSETDGRAGPCVIDFDAGSKLPDEVFHKARPQEECLHSNGNLQRNDSIGKRISEKNGRTLIEEYHNGHLDLSDSENLANETVDLKNGPINGRPGNNLRNRASAGMTPIYVSIPDSKDISMVDDLDGATSPSRELLGSQQLTSCEEKTSKYAPDHRSKWSSSDHSKPADRGYASGNRWQDEEKVAVHVSHEETNSVQRVPKWKTFAEDSETLNKKRVDFESVQETMSNTSNRQSPIFQEQTLNSFKELNKNFVNGRRENTTQMEGGTTVRRDSSQYDGLHDNSHSKDITRSKINSDRATFKNSSDLEEEFSPNHSANGITIGREDVQLLGKSVHKINSSSSVRQSDEKGVSTQNKAGFEKSVEKNSFTKETTEINKEGATEKLSSITNYGESGKVTSENRYTSDKVSMISSNGSFKQNSQREEQKGDGRFRSSIQDSTKVGTSSEGKKMPVAPKKSIKMLDYLLDSLDETAL